ncbi:MAG: acylneuraminate cytidylyltransferase family protein [Dehalococcoidales bacterium]|nr:acylneuraminate cytidylyltransferase family protein [Dehalococcoidales bacterium]
MSAPPSVIALIPARAGSKRLQGKNIQPLAGHPLMAYTIAAALESRIFQDVIVSTDSDLYADIARYYGAGAPFLRPPAMAGDTSPDIEWIEFTLKRLREQGRSYDCFSILRPTSPFRQPETITRAWREFLAQEGVDSLRAVEKCQQHPGKMWIVNGKRMTPLLPQKPGELPYHSTPYQALPEVYAQNASLEIAWSRVVFEGRTIAGNILMPFFTRDYEGFDINQPIDWRIAEELISAGKTNLPRVTQSPFPMEEK